MDKKELYELLTEVEEGTLSVDRAVEQLRDLPYADLGFAKVDHHRHLRRGFPEVILCEGKTVKQVVDIFLNLSKTGHNVLATRATEQMGEACKKALNDDENFKYNKLSKTMSLMQEEEPEKVGNVLIITAGTSDIPAAEEAAVTAEIMGSNVQRMFDVGVAGLHRLLGNRGKLKEARVIIVAAGMEGALASVVGGLVDKPVIALPTSVGYGASFNGLAALLGMLNSCSSGVGVVNIDNGFGAAYLANLINRLGEGGGK